MVLHSLLYLLGVRLVTNRWGYHATVATPSWGTKVNVFTYLTRTQLTNRVDRLERVLTTHAKHFFFAPCIMNVNLYVLNADTIYNVTVISKETSVILMGERN